MADFTEKTCGEVQAMIDAGQDFLLLDCRELQEHAIASIATARLIPMSEITSRVGEIAEHRELPVVVMCHHGMRSAQVAAWLAAQGFTDVSSMTGGIDQWSQEIDPQTPRY